MALEGARSTLWKRRKCLNLKHLVMYRNPPTTFCGFPQKDSTNMVLDTSALRRYSIEERYRRKNKNYVTSGTRCSTYCWKLPAPPRRRPPARMTRWFWLRLPPSTSSGLHLSRDPHRGRIVSPLDSGGAAPRCRGDSSLPHFRYKTGIDRTPYMAHSYCRRSIAAIR